jgi:hypothetical protein
MAGPGSQENPLGYMPADVKRQPANAGDVVLGSLLLLAAFVCAVIALGLLVVPLLVPGYIAKNGVLPTVVGFVVFLGISLFSFRFGASMLRSRPKGK